MIKALKKKYALSDQGAKDLLKGIVYSVLANISLMFPVILLAIVLNQLLAPVLGASAPEISAAVYWGLNSMLRFLTSPLNLPAPGRRQPIYLTFRFRIDLCFC